MVGLFTHTNFKSSYTREPVFGLLVGGVKQNVVVSPSIATSILSSPKASSAAVIDYLTENVFGDKGAIRHLKPSDFREFQKAGTLHDPFSTEALRSEICLIERETSNLVSFCRSPVDQGLWERASRVTVIDNTDPLICEANLFSLVRDFTAYVTTSVFMGQAFVESSFPGLEDLWAVDNNFISLFSGVPRWFPSSGVSSAHPARQRLLNKLAIFHQSVVDWHDGKDPGVEFRDLDDVSEHMKERILISKRLGLSPYASASGHMSQLWSLLRHTPKIVFWNLIHIHADRKLLEDIRKEIMPYAKASRPNPQETGFPIPEPPKLVIDVKGLQESCPLLTASYYETLRLHSAGVSFRQLTSDLDVAESESDAVRDGLTKPRKYGLKKGDYVAISHGAHQRDTRYFQNPTQYNHRRFMNAESETSEKTAVAHTFTPFHDDVFEAKDHSFMQSEILAFTAAILSLWEISPAGGGEWNIPGNKSTIGVFPPSKDVRVRMKIRV